MILERDVARAVDAYLDMLGLKAFRADQGGGRFSRRTVGVGLPDRFGILPNGRWFAIELKRPGARPRPNEAKQNAVLDYLRANGALVIVANSVADVQAVVNPITIRHNSYKPGELTYHAIVEDPPGSKPRFVPPLPSHYAPERDE